MTMIGSERSSVRAAQVLTASTSPVVNTTAGRVRGARERSVDAFKGIPYGGSCVPPRRFMPSVASEPWPGVRDTVALGARSIQPTRIMVPEMGDTLTGSGRMDEDCLFLNVWTPAVGTGRRPVMVYLHGGGFRTGSGGAAMYDGHELSRKRDVVVVTLNHRLNVFGFLYLGHLGSQRHADSANVGMRDIVLALEWIRDNIEAFGGDPRNVTVFGQSGGGGKTSMLTAWPAAKGLFHRAIIQSTLSDTAVRALSVEEAARATDAFLRRLNVNAGQLDALQTVAADAVLAALVGSRTGAAAENPRDVRPAGGAPELTGDLSLRFTPIVDGRWLPAHPYDPVAPQVSSDVPVLCGSVETESVPYQAVDDPYWSTSDIDEDTLLRRVMNTLRVDRPSAADGIGLYRKQRPKASRMDLATIVASDNGVLRTSEYTIAERRHALNRAPVYMYYFQWYSPVHEGRVRAMHGIELPFVFDHVDDVTFMVGRGADRQALADAVSAAWVAFARSGNPTHKGLPAWPAFTPSTRSTMVFNTRSRVVDDPYGAERRLLASLRERHGDRS